MLWYPRFLRARILFCLIIRLYFIYSYLIERLPEDDLKKIETCRSISWFYLKVYILNTFTFIGIIY
jgi:hypothetical protein